MNFEEFKQTLDTINVKLMDDVITSIKLFGDAKKEINLTDISNRYLDSYCHLIDEGLDSVDKSQMINCIAYQLIDRVFIQRVVISLVQSFAGFDKPVGRDEIKLINSLFSQNSFLNHIFDKHTLARRKGAEVMLANCPVQSAKKNIEEEYKIVKNQFKRRGYSAQFIREMKEKYTKITDIKTIERLVTKLNKLNEEIPPKPAKKVVN